MRLPFLRPRPATPAAPQASPVRDSPSRLEDHFARALEGALAPLPYDLLSNVQLVDFLALSYGHDEQGTLARQALAQADFLIVGRQPAVPLLGIALSRPTVARDRRRRTPPSRPEALETRSIVTLLKLAPQDHLDPGALRKLLRRHLP